MQHVHVGPINVLNNWLAYVCSFIFGKDCLQIQCKYGFFKQSSSAL